MKSNARMGRIAGKRGGGGAAVEDDVAALTVDARGMIRYCNRAGESLFKYRRSELAWRHVSLLLPELADVDLLENGEVNSRLRFLYHIGRPFRALTQQGERFDGELFLNVLDSSGGGRLSLIVRPSTPARAALAS